MSNASIGQKTSSHDTGSDEHDHSSHTHNVCSYDQYTPPN
jgi:hypothetical protein